MRRKVNEKKWARSLAKKQLPELEQRELPAGVSAQKLLRWYLRGIKLRRKFLLIMVDYCGKLPRVYPQYSDELRLKTLDTTFLPAEHGLIKVIYLQKELLRAFAYPSELCQCWGPCGCQSRWFV